MILVKILEAVRPILILTGFDFIDLCAVAVQIDLDLFGTIPHDVFIVLPSFSTVYRYLGGNIVIQEIANQVISIFGISRHAAGAALVVFDSALFDLVLILMEMVFDIDVSVSFIQIGEFIFPTSILAHGIGIKQLVIPIELDGHALGTFTVAVVVIIPRFCAGYRHRFNGFFIRYRIVIHHGIGTDVKGYLSEIYLFVQIKLLRGFRLLNGHCTERKTVSVVD